MRHIPPSMDLAVVARIDAALGTISAGNGVTIALAIESGSRAWGFPSPDSDYDCRFIYVRPVAQYLTPWPARDVIELPLDSELDVNGWDLPKALRLLTKGNAVVIEWLTSPIAYAGDAAFRDEMVALAHRTADRTLVARHYLHLGDNQRRMYFTDTDAVPVKKLFYALRPAAALRWLRLHPEAAVAPMHFPTLMAQCDPPQEVAGITADLLVRKAATRELGTAPLPPAIGRFIDEELGEARMVFESYDRRDATLAARAACEAFFRAWATRLDPAPA